MKTVWVNRVVIGIGLVGVTILYFAVVQWLHWYGWLVELIWLIGMQLLFDRFARKKRRALTKLWTLADQLGYDAAKLSQLTPQYGRLDWQLSRPDNFQFQPSDAAIAKVTAQLEQDLEAKHAVDQGLTN